MNAGSGIGNDGFLNPWATPGSNPKREWISGAPSKKTSGTSRSLNSSIPRRIVWDVDWATVSIHSRDSALTERVLRAWDEHLADPSLPRTLGARLRSAGFEDVRVEAHAFADGGDPERFGAALVPMIATFVAGRQGLGKVEANAWAAEQRELMEGGDFYFASTQFCFTATKSV